MNSSEKIRASWGQFVNPATCRRCPLDDEGDWRILWVFLTGKVLYYYYCALDSNRMMPPTKTRHWIQSVNGRRTFLSHRDDNNGSCAYLYEVATPNGATLDQLGQQ